MPEKFERLFFIQAEKFLMIGNIRERFLGDQPIDNKK